jgi:anaerobic ribonucleoside-triphosphate reductase
MKAETPEESTTAHSAPSIHISDSSLAAPSPMKQLNLMEMMKRGSKKTGAAVSSETQTQDDLISSVPPQ